MPPILAQAVDAIYHERAMPVSGAVLRRLNATSNSRARIASSTLLIASIASEGEVAGKRVITSRSGSTVTPQNKKVPLSLLYPL
jgi:hypothetical protein